MYSQLQLYLPVLLLGAGASIASGTNISSSSCDSSCQQPILKGASWEADQHASRDFSFYSIPSNFSSTMAPGSLLDVERVTNLTNYTVPSGLSMSRIIYTTSNVNGTILPASAYVLWPYAPFKTSEHRHEGFPMVAWAHGTSGVFKACAPSNYRNLQYHFMAPFALALQGMAVVAPDYSGLGISSLPDGQEIHHPWLTGRAQANDLANAIVAARKAFPKHLKAEGPFVAMGHSQGGGAAWAFAERQANDTIPGYKGTVAIAPPTRSIQLLEWALGEGNTTQPWAQVQISGQPRLIASVTALFPSYNYSGFTPVSYDQWFNVLKPLDGCLPTDGLVYSNVSVDQISQPDWYNAPQALEWAKIAENGRKKFKGPLLVIGGEADIVVPLDTVNSAVDDTCRMAKEQHWGESLEMVSYSAMDHFPVIQASQMKWMSWAKDRLSDVPLVKAGCVKHKVDGFRTNDTVQSAKPNFLELWASLEDSWKYSL